MEEKKREGKVKGRREVSAKVGGDHEGRGREREREVAKREKRAATAVEGEEGDEGRREGWWWLGLARGGCGWSS